MGTVQRVLEQDIGTHDVFVGMERRLREVAADDTRVD